MSELPRPGRRPRTISPGRPPKAEFEAREMHILNIAAEEFLARGFGDANIARIATAAGVSNKTIYARYANKDELLLAVVRDLSGRVHERLKVALSLSEGDPKQMLTTFGMEVARAWASPLEVGLYRLVVSEVTRYPGLAMAYRQAMEPFGTTLAAYLKRKVLDGALDLDDAEQAARQFGMLIYGEVRERALFGEPPSDAEILRLVESGVRIFLSGCEYRGR